MAGLIDEAAAAKPDGIAVTVPDPAVLHAPILQAIQAGYPVVAYDTGAGPVKDDLPYLTFIGTDVYAEYRGGYLAALRLINSGASEGVCVNHQMGHTALDARCRGMMDAFSVEGLRAEVLDCGADPEQALQIIQEYAQHHEQVNAYLTMGPGEPGAVSFYRYLETSNRPRGQVLHGTFDLSPAVVTAIEDGTSLFAVDGQPYLMGYSAVMFLTLALRHNIWPAEAITPTGPGFVDLSNIAIVKQLAGIYR
jgi:simple sugar transport system substrate-binding protein